MPPASSILLLDLEFGATGSWHARTGELSGVTWLGQVHANNVLICDCRSIVWNVLNHAPYLLNSWQTARHYQ